MSVVDKVIFCEGKQTSLDIKLLERVLAEQPGQRLTIVSAGGKFTFSVFAQGYFFPDEAINKRYIIFRDRDFDVQPTSEVKLLKRGQRCFLTHRACIENYLLDADLIHNYWQAKFAEKSENPLSKWGHGDSVGIETITAWIYRSARTLRDYQAVRWALADVAKPSVGSAKALTTNGEALKRSLRTGKR